MKVADVMWGRIRRQIEQWLKIQNFKADREHTIVSSLLFFPFSLLDVVTPVPEARVFVVGRTEEAVVVEGLVPALYIALDLLYLNSRF